MKKAYTLVLYLVLPLALLSQPYLTELSPSISYQGDRFGISTALSDNGDYLIVGAIDNSSLLLAEPPRIFIFNKVQSNWIEVNRLKAPGQYMDINATGTRIASSGRDVQSARATVIHTRSGNHWTSRYELKVPAPTQSDPDRKVSHEGPVAISGNLTLLGSTPTFVRFFGRLIGTQKAYLFNGSNLVRTFSSQSNRSRNAFGAAVDISDDGSTIVIGDRVEGAAYIYQQSGSSSLWSLVQKLTPAGTKGNFGAQVSLDQDASRIVVGNSSRNRVFIYRQEGARWILEQEISKVDPYHEFGARLKLSADGENLIVGAPASNLDFTRNAGAAFRFKRFGTNWSSGQLLQVSEPFRKDRLGLAVGVDQNGGNIVLGSPRDGNARGSAYTICTPEDPCCGAPPIILTARPVRTFNLESGLDEPMVVIRPEQLVQATSCSATELELAFSPDFTTNFKTFSCEDGGLNQLVVYARDDQGHQANLNLNIIIDDESGLCEQPACLENRSSNFINLSIELQPLQVPSDVNGDGLVDEAAAAVQAIDFLAAPIPGASFSFSSDPNDQVLVLSCRDIGTRKVLIWITYPDGRQQTVSTYICVFDVGNSCSDQCRGNRLFCQDIQVFLDPEGVAQITAADILSPLSSLCDCPDLLSVQPNQFDERDLGTNLATLSFRSGTRLQRCRAIVEVLECEATNLRNERHRKPASNYLAIGDNSKNQTTDFDYQIFPNPTQDRIVINPKFSSKGQILLEIFDIQGRKRYSKSYLDESMILDLEKLNIEAGVFTIIITSENAVFSRKILKLE